MTQSIKSGDTISVEYTGKLDNGEVFDTSEGREPLTFEVGAGQLIKGFDEAVVDMSVGDSKTVTVTPEEAYGERREDLFISMPLGNVPPDMTLEVGMMVQLTDKSGNPVPAIVTDIGSENVTLDINHPLAGKELTFDIKVVDIK